MILSGAIFIPLVMTFFWKKATPNAGFYSILVSTAVVLAGLFFEGLTSTNPIIYGMSSGFIVLVGISYLTNYRKKTSNVEYLKETKQL
jgi:SSS family solute:Na+ symporter